MILEREREIEIGAPPRPRSEGVCCASFPLTSQPIYFWYGAVFFNIHLCAQRKEIARKFRGIIYPNIRNLTSNTGLWHNNVDPEGTNLRTSSRIEKALLSYERRAWKSRSRCLSRRRQRNLVCPKWKAAISLRQSLAIYCTRLFARVGGSLWHAIATIKAFCLCFEPTIRAPIVSTFKAEGRTVYHSPSSKISFTISFHFHLFLLPGLHLSLLPNTSSHSYNVCK